MFEGPEPTAPSKEGEAAEEGQLGPTKRRAPRDVGEAATMPCLSTSSPAPQGPARRGYARPISSSTLRGDSSS